MFEPKKILVPTDFSENSDKALKEALDIADKYHSQVYLLHVIDRNVQQCAVDYCITNAQVEQLENESMTKSKEMMKDEVSKIAKAKAVEINFDIKKGVPYNEIVKEQENNGIDLIVMASHGKTGFMKHMLGSVTDKVIKKATSPVLLVRA